MTKSKREAALSQYTRAEICSDGKTVWVNGEDGCCIARFSWFGIDIHKNSSQQMAGGSQCLECKAGAPSTLADWAQFQAGVMRHYGIKIAKRRMPKFLSKGRIL